tara:strand:+ start:55 stop:351 length:297 start_codon:yes stop_codon:yes gene_type:complete
MTPEQIQAVLAKRKARLAREKSEKESDDECCKFCGEYDDCLMMCEGCNKSGCPECVKSYYGEHFGDCKKCCEKAGFPEGNCWESECTSGSDEGSDEDA